MIEFRENFSEFEGKFSDLHDLVKDKILADEKKQIPGQSNRTSPRHAHHHAHRTSPRHGKKKPFGRWLWACLYYHSSMFLKIHWQEKASFLINCCDSINNSSNLLLMSGALNYAWKRTQKLSENRFRTWSSTCWRRCCSTNNYRHSH